MENQTKRDKSRLFFILWLCSLTFLLALIIGLSIGWNNGAIAVASGQFTGQLVEKQDKTNYWIFEKNDKK